MTLPTSSGSVWCIFNAGGTLSSIHTSEEAARDYLARMSEFANGDYIEAWYVHAKKEAEDVPA